MIKRKSDASILRSALRQLRNGIAFWVLPRRNAEGVSLEPNLAVPSRALVLGWKVIAARRWPPCFVLVREASGLSSRLGMGMARRLLSELPW